MYDWRIRLEGGIEMNDNWLRQPRQDECSDENDVQRVDERRSYIIWH